MGFGAQVAVVALFETSKRRGRAAKGVNRRLGFVIKVTSGVIKENAGTKAPGETVLAGCLVARWERRQARWLKRAHRR
jgi:hypothetical protein